MRMDEDQARALWELLRNISKKAEIGKQELWKDEIKQSVVGIITQHFSDDRVQQTKAVERD